jgi:Ca2+-binding RTX toxin-like protein
MVMLSRFLRSCYSIFTDTKTHFSNDCKHGAISNKRLQCRNQVRLFERLEERQQFAVSASFVNGLYTLASDRANDTMTLSVENIGMVDYLLVRDNGNNILQNTLVRASDVSKIIVVGGEGNDFIDMQRLNRASLPGIGTTRGLITLNAGAGDDTVFGSEFDEVIQGETGTNYLYGEDGNDAIYGGGNDDYMFGGEGNDRFYPYAGNDYMEGGEDGDIYYYSQDMVGIDIINDEHEEDPEDDYFYDKNVLNL